MEKKLVITKINNNIVSSIFEDLNMVEVNISEQNPYTLGNIYVGHVENIIKNINSAFVEIAKGVKCYYSLDDNKQHIFFNNKNTDKVNIGDRILVQISKEGIKTKLPSLSSEINLPGKYVVLVSNAKQIMISNKITNKSRINELKTLMAPIFENTTFTFNFIVRTNAELAENDEICKEALKLKEQYEEMMQIAPFRPQFTQLYSSKPSYISDILNIQTNQLEQIVTDDPELYLELHNYFKEGYPDEFSKLKLYEDPLLSLSKLFNVEGQIKAALQKKVWLKSGGYLIIEPTEALTVIDVNTGKFSGNKKDKEDTFLKINLEAAEEIGHQLRLRNLSGIIIVDFINMMNENNKEILLSSLEHRLRKDSISTTLIGMTKLNLVEITRKKIRKPLHETYKDIF